MTATLTPEDLAKWLVSLDKPDTVAERRAVALADIIANARRALDTSDMWERVGEEVGTRRLVNNFYDRVQGDPLLIAIFIEKFAPVGGIAVQRRHFAQALGALLGAPGYEGVDLVGLLREKHKDLHITREQYWRTIGHLCAAMAELGVPEDIFTFVVTTARRVEPVVTGGGVV